MQVQKGQNKKWNKKWPLAIELKLAKMKLKLAEQKFGGDPRPLGGRDP